MVFLFYTLLVLVILQRFAELVISRRNEVWLRQKGAVEHAPWQMKFIVLVHALFFVSMVSEFEFVHVSREFSSINYFFLIFFLILQALRVSVINTLGKYWNVKILRISGGELVGKGLYKFVKHPNYIIVALEFISLPMIFNLYYTAVIFTILNALLMIFRIPAENRALQT